MVRVDEIDASVFILYNYSTSFEFWSGEIIFYFKGVSISGLSDDGSLKQYVFCEIY